MALKRTSANIRQRNHDEDDGCNPNNAGECSLQSADLIFYKEVFKLFDKDGNGNIDSQELEEIMKSMNANGTAQEISLMINNIDFNKTGKVDFDEFVAVLQATKISRKPVIAQERVVKDEGQAKELLSMDFVPDSDESLAEAFRTMTSNGMIIPSDLERVLHTLGFDCKDDLALAMINDIDTKGTGSVCFDDFCAMMRSG